jgi:hypothetical protein
MNDLMLVEGIYVKRSIGSFGLGATSRESVMESLWFPYRAENGFVELFPVMDNLQRVLRIPQRVPAKLFNEEYALKDNSRELYLNLKKTLPG